MKKLIVFITLQLLVVFACSSCMPEVNYSCYDKPIYNSISYSNYLNSLRLRNISVKSIIDAHAKKRGKVQNTLPPEKLWSNIGPTLYVIEKIANYLHEDVVEIVSVYRSPEYNKKCTGAASHSQHMKNKAVDVKFSCSPQKVAKAARYLRSQGLFKGGIGVYPTWTHIDTRGYNVDWQ